MPRRPRTLQSMPRTLRSMPRTLRSMPRRPRTLPSMLRSCQASLHILGSHIKRVWNLVVHYSLGFTAYKAASGGIFLRCGTLRTLRKSMPRRPKTLQSMPRTLRSMPRRPRTLPSMPRSCQTSLHILGSHKKKLKNKFALTHFYLILSNIRKRENLSSSSFFFFFFSFFLIKKNKLRE